LSWLIRFLRNPCGVEALLPTPERNMSKEKPNDDPRQETDQSSHKQTDKPWKGNPEKERRNEAETDLEKWHRTNTH